MIPRGSQSRAGTPISLIVLHTAEGATTAAGLEHYLDQPGVEASYHKMCDDTTTITYLPDEVASWSVLSGNNRSLNVCVTGFAKWPTSEWLAHDGMLHRAATVARDWCAGHHIPAVKLSPAGVGADQWGICGHWDWTIGKRDGTHTDPGPNFPWDVFISYVNQGGPPIPPGPGPDSIPTMTYGERSDNVLRLQRFMTSHFASYNQYEPTGLYWTKTRDGIAEFQRRTGIDANGVMVGPRTKLQLWRYGYRP
ncbi:MAG: N-acetylmuramoyl-L-alanine amidase [Actinobacteria bacterium]|nr:N-acetylmuramoyl-L-alanine amidase [Actinomycetota bacterium]